MEKLIENVKSHERGEGVYINDISDFEFKNISLISSLDDLMDWIENYDLYVKPEDDTKFMLKLGKVFPDQDMEKLDFNKPSIYKVTNLIKTFYDFNYYNLQCFIRTNKYEGETYIEGYLNEMTNEQLDNFIKLIVTVRSYYRLILSKQKSIHMLNDLTNELRFHYIDKFGEEITDLSDDRLSNFGVLPKETLIKIILRYCDLTPVLLDNMAEAYLEGSTEEESFKIAFELVRRTYALKLNSFNNKTFNVLV